MVHAIDETVRELERAHPGWHVWYVPRAVGGFIWCARRYGQDTGPALNAGTPEHLAEYIAEQV